MKYRYAQEAIEEAVGMSHTKSQDPNQAAKFLPNAIVYSYPTRSCETVEIKRNQEAFLTLQSTFTNPRLEKSLLEEIAALKKSTLSGAGGDSAVLPGNANNAKTHPQAHVGDDDDDDDDMFAGIPQATSSMIAQQHQSSLTETSKPMLGVFGIKHSAKGEDPLFASCPVKALATGTVDVEQIIAESKMDDTVVDKRLVEAASGLKEDAYFECYPEYASMLAKSGSSSSKSTEAAGVNSRKRPFESQADALRKESNSNDESLKKKRRFQHMMSSVTKLIDQKK
eukprot:ANDGO_05228.mRNA.1 hypothetical protein